MRRLREVVSSMDVISDIEVIVTRVVFTYWTCEHQTPIQTTFRAKKSCSTIVWLSWISNAYGGIIAVSNSSQNNPGYVTTHNTCLNVRMFQYCSVSNESAYQKRSTFATS